MKRKKLRIITIFLVLISFILLLMSVLNTYLILKYDVLPFKYLIVYIILVIIFPVLLVMSNFKKKNKRKKKLKIFTIFIEIIYIIALAAAFFYLSKTFSFLDSFASKIGYDIKNYYVVTLESNKLDNIEDAKDISMGFVKDQDNFNKALDMVEKKVKPKYKEYKNHDELFKDLYDKKVETVLLLDSYYDLFHENETEENATKIIYKFSIKEKVEVESINSNVSKEPFNIYISGMDDYGKISERSRSDVNIIVSINPVSNEILLINVPRDYYVTLPTYNQKDKLTHAGIYGVKESVGALEKLLDIKIDYYFKVNYSALIQLIDAIDGVNVYSEYDFKTLGTGHNYHFNKGYNFVDGEHALEFARTREAFTFGDRVRGENQQRLIKAIVEKVTGSTVLLRKYGTILNSLNGTFLTNISTDEITDLVKLQLDKMPKWNITSISLNGSDGHEYVYSYSGQPLYVMIPDEKTVSNAKELLQKLKNGEKIEVISE